MTAISKAQQTKLAQIVEGTNSSQGFVYMTEKSVKVLVDANLVECNIGVSNEDGVAVRATQLGTDYANGPAEQPQGNEPVNQPVNTEPTFVILSDRPIPAITRVGAASKYPFAQLGVGQSFFVPATEASPTPHKSMASTIATASKRFGKVVGKRTINRKVNGEMTATEVDKWAYGRKFMVRKSTLDGVDGAEVFRIAVPDGEGLPQS